ncbi:sensor histidine kinase [Pseudodesulfovibrio piezophilus]|uniref:histidine kinase n=1 Tax=Pseudodesulfovibrio piezophilus (strain DSM 21447 / JCM 15486 / C1TLV30) TaxID=1322246 RepID=M1WMF5_PSEP2|nr:HAMP domain-containing histidine kinase [Pseudodesulfovibrio piezophilus]CCH49515.1 Histidine kinase A domain protein [Pseudodesulfovibrio piezophilus C1TLV30]
MKYSAETQQSLQFFGTISASVSHEIKNVFAVINEGAGLLSDLALMVEKGVPVDPERLTRAAATIQGQVQRGDAIVRNMNRFSHSTDDAVQEVNLCDIAELTVSLTRRMADMKQIQLQLECADPVMVQAAPFFLIRLIHEIIACLMEAVESGGTLVVTTGEKDGVGDMTFSVPGQTVALMNEANPGQLAHDMGLSLTTDKHAKTLNLRFR